MAIPVNPGPIFAFSGALVQQAKVYDDNEKYRLRKIVAHLRFYWRPGYFVYRKTGRETGKKSRLSGGRERQQPPAPEAGNF
ncbi:hypothetical protein C7M52_00174 [Mixta theicola]|nr:hypothetical protein [Mixta theicola]QHM74251.1 hypothetical protein C7M52_00174 [Mixta theicola]